MLELTDGNVNLLIGDEELAALRVALDGLTAQEGLATALLIDSAGKIIAASGSTGHLDTSTIAALAAGDYATTRALARRVGERSFSLVFQRDRNLNACLQAVNDEALLVVLFTSAIPLGGVRAAIRQAQAGIRKALLRANRTVTGAGEVARILEERAPGAARDAGAPATPAPATGEPEAAGDVVRRFWRIKALAEDCVRIQVSRACPTEWRASRERLAEATGLLAEGQRDRCLARLDEVEALLRRAYEVALSVGREGGEEWTIVRLLHDLVGVSTEQYRAGLGDAGVALLAHVDRESAARHAGLLAGVVEGTIQPAAVQALASMPRDQRHRAILRAFLDLLLSRYVTAYKIFGDAAAAELAETWRRIVEERGEDVTRLGMRPALLHLFEEIGRRRASPAVERRP